jgi:hypothetical protein
VALLKPECVCVGCLFLRTPSRAPYRTPPNRAAYPDPPPRSPRPSRMPRAAGAPRTRPSGPARRSRPRPPLSAAPAGTRAAGAARAPPSPRPPGTCGARRPRLSPRPPAHPRATSRIHRRPGVLPLTAQHYCPVVSSHGLPEQNPKTETGWATLPGQDLTCTLSAYSR